MSLDAPLARTTAGEVLGCWEDSVAMFRGVPYAEPPLGPRRFAPPTRPTPWEGARSAQHQAAAPPQVPGRGLPIMGPMDVPGYDEDCLTLNVWTPSIGASDNLPVFVWFHGGGLMEGAGSASWYDGRVMARRGQLVVVTVNYRLGALGYLYLPPGVTCPEGAANLGLQDQCLALEWVRENVGAFGGDPNNVTVAGQSAGGVSIVGLAAMPRARGLFRRAILQSSGLAMPGRSVEEAMRATDLFLEESGTALDGEALRTLSVDRILEAQGRALMRVAQSIAYDPRLRPMAMVPVRFVVDGEVLPEEPCDAARSGSMDAVDLLLMVTSEEMNFVYAFDDAYWTRSRDELLHELTTAWGPQGADVYAAYETRMPNRTAPEVFIEMLSREGLEATFELAEQRIEAGRPCHFAWFTWRSPGVGGRVGPAHTVELPFVFNNFENWTSAPLMQGADPEEIRALGDQMQDAWASFVATGSPAEKWPPFDRPDFTAMEFGTTVDLINDPGAGRQRTVDFMRTQP